MPEPSQSMEYPWESVEYVEQLKRCVQATGPESHDGLLYLYLPSRSIARHFVDIRLDDGTSPAEFLRDNAWFVIAACATAGLAGLLAVLLSAGVRSPLGPIGLMSTVVVTVALVGCALLLLAFIIGEGVDWSPAATKLAQLKPTYDGSTFDAELGSLERLEHDVRLVLRERIGLWIAGGAAALEPGEARDLTADQSFRGSEGRAPVESWEERLGETLGLTPTQFARLKDGLLRELRSAASYDLIGGIWGQLTVRDGKLVIERRQAERNG